MKLRLYNKWIMAVSNVFQLLLHSKLRSKLKVIYKDITPIMENQLEDTLENQMETGITGVVYWVIGFRVG